MIVSSPGEKLERSGREDSVRSLEVKMERGISLLQDLNSLWRLYRVMRQFRPDLTDVGTPKAGLLGGLAAWLNRVPCRIYLLHGLRCETATGLKRRVLHFTERLACYCAHRVICVSESLRQKAVSLGIVELDRTAVLGSGSCNGVDAELFAPTADRFQAALELRRHLGIPKEAPVIGFVGRFVADKGIAELFEAYSQLRQNFPELRLLLVGDFEEGDPVPQQLRERIKSDPHVTVTGFVQDVARYYHVMDVLALPTRREGFPTVILEAHAAGKPVVTFRATGAVDAVVDGVDGIVVAVGDVQALAEALASLIGNPSLAQTMGRNGYDRVLREFQPIRIWSAFADTYVRSLKEKGISCDAIRLDGPKPSLVEDLQEASN
jgi:glycosyltransferase involved in cell wall biosynthesis